VRDAEQKYTNTAHAGIAIGRYATTA